MPSVPQKGGAGSTFSFMRLGGPIWYQRRTRGDDPVLVFLRRRQKEKRVLPAFGENKLVEPDGQRRHTSDYVSGPSVTPGTASAGMVQRTPAGANADSWHSLNREKKGSHRSGHESPLRGPDATRPRKTASNPSTMSPSLAHHEAPPASVACLADAPATLPP
jgi:hypothetical protein